MYGGDALACVLEVQDGRAHSALRLWTRRGADPVQGVGVYQPRLKAWACTSPDCGFNLRIDNGEISFGRAIGQSFK